MTQFPLDVVLVRNALRLSALPRPHVALFFAACAERFFPLYETFSRTTSFGSPSEVRDVLDEAWTNLSSPIPRFSTAALQRLENRYTPHSDDFGTVECLLAQSAVDCIGASIRALSNSKEFDERWIEIPFEGLRAAVTEQLTGFMDLGDAPGRESLEQQLIRDARIVKELSNQKIDLDELERRPEMRHEVIERFRERAAFNKWTTEDVFHKQ